MTLTDKSKFLSFVLRHKPDAANLTLDKDGWTDVDHLSKNTNITLLELQQIVAEDEKGRYSFSEDGSKIRANQGHSTSSVKMTFKKAVPPIALYHGTIDGPAKASILKKGLIPMKRHHVHLTDDLDTAKTVGGRRKGHLLILEIDTAAMLKDGYEFFLSDNGVWLIDAVPPKYLKDIS